MAEKNYGIPTQIERREKLPDYPFSTQDEGGPRELKAHMEDKEFECLVRWDGRRGYIFYDANGERKTGIPYITDKAGTKRRKPPVIVSVLLREHDQNAMRLESKDKALDLILRERSLIRYFRSHGYGSPIKAACVRLEAEEEVWDEAGEYGLTPSQLLDAKLQGKEPESVRKDEYILHPLREEQEAPSHRSGKENLGRKRRNRGGGGGGK